MEKENPGLNEEKKINKTIRRKTIISFSVFMIGGILAVYFWKWLNSQPEDKAQPAPIRKVLNANEKVNTMFFSNKHIAKEYSKSEAATKARVNGDIGMGEEFDPANWFLSVKKQASKKDSVLQLKLIDIKTLPKRDIIFDFKCIEGWSQVTHWGGTRFSDFLRKYHLGTKSGKDPDEAHPEDLYKYVGLVTPDSAYYVGIDMKSMMHPQTILCYELNEKPLPLNQGYPLRLIITVKYGIKSLKRIGYIYFSDTRPKDYWYERGYDYDSAL